MKINAGMIAAPISDRDKISFRLPAKGMRATVVQKKPKAIQLNTVGESAGAIIVRFMRQLSGTRAVKSMIAILSFAAGAFIGILATGFFWWCFASVENDHALNPLSELGELPPALSSVEIDEHVRRLGHRYHDNKVAFLIVVTVMGQQEQYYPFGTLPDGTAPDENTIFELASVGKTFTGLLLADVVARGESRLDVSVLELMPDVGIPTAAPIANVTLKQLATHSSGLPSLPSNLPATNPLNPYVDYSVPLLHQELAKLKLQSEPGRHYAYSNLGFGLLGQCLSRVLKSEYEDAVVNRICRPLAMDDTRMTLTETQKARIAQPHNGENDVVVWEDTTLAGAGSFLSTPHDMAIYMRSYWDGKRPDLANAMKISISKNCPTDLPQRSMGLGWHIDSENALDIVWHNGGSGGSRCYVAMLPDHQIGVGVFANWAQANVDELGKKVLYLQLRR